MAKVVKNESGGVVKEIVYPDMSSGLEGSEDTGVVKDIIYPDANSGVEPDLPSGNPMEIEEPIDTPVSIPGEGEANITTTPKATVKTTSKGGTTQQLKNADLNFNQYGDDSSAANQDTAGGMYDKYEGEGVKTSNVNYNPNASIDTLNPNYQYGMDAQWANSASAGYIARRNDEIASALYNAGMTSKDDVINFLAQQKGWNNATEKDRVNTVESIWKRLGSIVNENPGAEEENIEGVNVNEEGLDRMKEDLASQNNTTGEIFGKVTPDIGNPVNGIQTNEDANSIYRMKDEARVANVKTLLSMSTDTIATSIWLGDTPTDSQAITDYQTWYPELWAQVQAKLGQIRGQNAVNDISNGETDYVTADVSSKEKLTENDKRVKAESVATSTDEVSSILSELNQDLSTNPEAVTAEDTMANITNEMNKLKTRLKNLRKEANTVFKGDASEAIVNAYINNRTQEINDRLKELQYNYDAAYQRNRDAIDDAWKEKEYNLKVRQINNQEDQAAWNKYYQQYQMSKDNVITDKDGKMWNLVQGSDGKWYYEEVSQRTRTYTVAERNNNPTNMTVGFMEWAGAEEGVDYKVSSDSFWSNGSQLNYATLLGDPIETTIKILDKAIANGKNPFNKTSWSYIDKLNIDVAKWNAMSHKEKSDLVTKWLQYEGGDMSNMAYYTDSKFSKGESPYIDRDSIEIPDSIYMVADEANQRSIKVDPDSEEGQKLRDKYIEEYAEKNGLLVGGRDELIGENGVDNAYEIISDDGETPVAYRQVLYNLVPTKLKDNVAELEKIYATAREMYRQKVPADEAALLWYGINPVTDDTTGMLSDVYLLARTAGVELNDTFYGNLGTATRSGNPKKMVTLLENSVLGDDIEAEEDSKAAIVDWIQQIEDALSTEEGKEFMAQAEADYEDYLEEIEDGKKPEDLVGFFNGTIEGLMNKYVGANKPYSELAAELSYLYGMISQEMLKGTGYTDAQIQLISPTIPKMTDYLGTIESKLDVLKRGMLAEVNSRRRRYDLLELDEYNLVDWDLRAKDYAEFAAEKKKQIEAQNAANGGKYVPNLS